MRKFLYLIAVLWLLLAGINFANGDYALAGVESLLAVSSVIIAREDE